MRRRSGWARPAAGRSNANGGSPPTQRVWSAVNIASPEPARRPRRCSRSHRDNITIRLVPGCGRAPCRWKSRRLLGDRFRVSRTSSGTRPRSSLIVSTIDLRMGVRQRLALLQSADGRRPCVAQPGGGELVAVGRHWGLGTAVWTHRSKRRVNESGC
jgi:hypothetical protein